MDGNLYIFDNHTNKISQKFSNFEDEILHFECHKKGDFVIACSKDTTIAIY